MSNSQEGPIIKKCFIAGTNKRAIARTHTGDTANPQPAIPTKLQQHQETLKNAKRVHHSFIPATKISLAKQLAQKYPTSRQTSLLFHKENKNAVVFHIETISCIRKKRIDWLGELL